MGTPANVHETMIGRIYDKRTKQHSQVVHCHHKSQCQRGFLGNSRIHRFIIDQRLDNTIAQSYQYAARYDQPFFGRNPYQCQPQCNTQQAVKLRLFLQILYNMPQKETGCMIARKKREIIIPEFPLEK